MSSAQAPKILVIEDETTQRILAKEYLESSGFVVRLADDGKRGLEMASAINPDLIILDLLLPSMDGYTLCTRLKQDPATANIPVILVTAAREADVIERGMAAGASDFVTKPVDWNYLADRVTHVLQQAQDMNRLTQENQVREQQLASLLANRDIAPEQIEEITKGVATPAQPENMPENTEAEIAAVRAEAEARVRQAEMALSAEREARATDAEHAAQRMQAATRSFWSMIARTNAAHIPLLTSLDQLTSGVSDEESDNDEFSIHATPQTVVQARLAETQNMVLLSKYMSNDAPLSERQVDLVAVIAEAMNRLKPEAERLQVALSVELPEHEVQIMADPTRLRYALMSVVTNALKYCPQKAVVRVVLSAEPGQPVSVTVSDNGVGMAPAQVQNLQQAAILPANAYKLPGGKFGFGIPISMAIMFSHDGVLSLDSEVGKGTTVCLQLPLTRRCVHDETQPADEQMVEASEPAQEADVPIARLNALLAS